MLLQLFRPVDALTPREDRYTLIQHSFVTILIVMTLVTRGSSLVSVLKLRCSIGDRDARKTYFICDGNIA